MSLPERCAVIALAAAIGSAHGAALGQALTPGLGRPAAEFPPPVISPDGAGLPAGSGTVAAGKAVYASRCAACHGADGRQAGNALVGGSGSLATDAPVKTVGSFWPYATTLWDYIAVAMPYGTEKSLSPDEVYAVTAYVLYLNDIVGAEAVLDRDSLPEIRMPNRDGFVELWR